MQFGFIGINYNKAQLDIRDNTSFTDVMKIDFFLKAEAIDVEQCMVLSTCNRSEVYFFFENEEQVECLIALYEATFPMVELREYMTSLTGKEAIAYVYRVAAGLESLVLGEDQILGQVKDALDFSRTMGHAKKELNKVIRDAVTCAKEIKTVFKISETPLSVSYIGIQKLNELCGIKDKRVLVIGSGKTAQLALKYIYEYGASEVVACSRSYAHEKELREEFPSMIVMEYEHRYKAMDHCDIVITATSSPHLVVRRGEFHVARPLFFLDLAAPRDVDITVTEEKGVRLLNLDTLQEIVKINQSEREHLVEESRYMINNAVEESFTWLIKSRVDETIGSLHQRCQEIVEDSYHYQIGRAHV